jgi:hypothetical protein
LVLFAIFRAGAAYLLDILPHNQWANDHMVQVAVRNWPDARLFVRLNMVTAETLSHEDRQRLRNGGVTSMVNVDGDAYVSGTFGISTARTATRASIKSDVILSNLRRYRDDPLALFNEFRSRPEFSGASWPKRPRFRVVSSSLDTCFGICILEELSGKRLLLG